MEGKTRQELTLAILPRFQARALDELPDGRYRVEAGPHEVFIRDNPQGEVYGLRVLKNAEEGKNSLLKPTTLLLFGAFSFKLSKEAPAKPLEASMPTFKRLLSSIRLREENAQALSLEEGMRSTNCCFQLFRRI